jgi:hypothetical protein
MRPPDALARLGARVRPPDGRSVYLHLQRTARRVACQSGRRALRSPPRRVARLRLRANSGKPHRLRY